MQMDFLNFLEEPNYKVFEFPDSEETIDPIAINVTDSDIKFTIDSPPDHISRHSTLINDDTLQFTHEQMMRLPHTVCCQVLFNHSGDQSFKSVLGDQKIDGMNLTPDELFLDNDTLILHEVKTRMYETDYIFDKAKEEARKYKLICYSLLERKIVKRVKYYITVIAQNKIETNFDIEYKTMENCSRFFSIASKLKILAINAGIKTGEPDDITLRSKEFIDSVLNFNPETLERKDSLMITTKMINHWKDLNVSMSPNESYKDLSKIMINAMKRTKMEEKTTNPVASDYSSFISKIEKQDCKISNKAIVQFPLLNPSKSNEFETKQWKTDTLVDLKHSTNQLHNFWYSILQQNPLEKTKDLSRIIEVSEMTPLEYKEFKRTNRREKQVHVQIDQDLSIYLAKSGVRGKRNKDDPEIKSKRENDKKPFDMETNTDDVDRFIKNYDLFNAGDINPVADDISDLVSMAQKFASVLISPIQPHEIITKLMNLKLFNYLTFLDEIFYEVNLSLSDNCDKDGFIFKKLKHYDCYLILRSTNSSKQIFFSLLYNSKFKVEHDFPFKKTFDLHSCCVTDFISLNRHKLSSLLNCTEKMMSIFLCLCNSFLKSSAELEDLDFNKEHYKNIIEHFNLTLLIYLENKPSTNKEFLQLRYMYMEFCKPYSNHPSKIFSKFSTSPRSRLLTWLYKRLFDLMTKTNCLKFNYDKLDEDDSSDQIQGIYSFVNFYEFDNYAQAITLSYLGLFCSKNDADFNQSSLKMFEKIIDQELKLRHARDEYMGYEDEPNVEYRHHEFSVTHMIRAGKKIRRIISRKHGDFDTYVKLEFSKVASSVNLNDLATTKASALDIKDVKFNNNIKMNKRRKCLEASIQEFVKNRIDYFPFTDLNKLFKSFSIDGGVLVNLFRKQQYAGLREIYVLTFLSRVVIHLVEQFSRFIGKSIPFDTMSLPSRKSLNTKLHYTKFERMRRALPTEETFICSDDAQTWSQQFVMPCFGAFFFGLMGESNDSFINKLMMIFFEIFNYVTLKRLELPKQLLVQFSKHESVKSFSQSLNVLKSQFYGETKDHDLIDEKGILLYNKSNMMQGILHFTSNIVHCGHLAVIGDFILLTCKKKLPYEIILTFKVSSDDSSMILTIFSNDPSISRDTIKRWGHIFSVFKQLSYPLMCARASYEKSTYNVQNHIEEFNSQWRIRNTLISALIKFFWSSIQNVPSTSFSNRITKFANERLALLREGCPIIFISLIQILQTYSHYKMMGAIVSPLWSQYKDNIKLIPHPCVGFFPHEPNLIVGIFGNRLATYLLVKNSSNSNKLYRMISNLKVLTLDEESGGLNITLKLGDYAKYEELLKKCEVDREELLKYVVKNPSIMLKIFKNDVDRLVDLKLKCLSPGIPDSMHFFDESKLAQTSVYMINTPCITVNNDLTTSKRSLHSIVKEMVDKIDSISNLSDKEMRFFFPESDAFDNSLSSLRHLSVRLSVVSRRKKRMVNFQVIDTFTGAILPLSELIAVSWFEKIPTKPKYFYKLSWTYYKSFLPWIDEMSLTKSLEQSPFDKELGMFGMLRFLSSQLKRDTKIHALSPSHLSSTNYGSLINLVKSMQFDGEILQNDYQTDQKDYKEFDYKIPDIKENSLSKEIQTFKTRLAIANTFPVDVRKSFIEQIYSKTEINYNLDDLKNINNFLTEDEIRLLVSHSLYGEEIKDQSKIEMMNLVSRGIFMYYSKRQKFDSKQMKYTGHGIIQGRVDRINFQIDVYDDQVRSITSSSVVNLEILLNTISPTLREFKPSTKTYDNAYAYASRFKSKFRVVTTKRGDDIPILINPDVRIQLKDSNLKDVRTKIGDQGQIRLIFNINNKDLTLYNCKLRNPNMNIEFKALEFDVNSMDDVVYSMVLNNKQIPEQDAISFYSSESPLSDLRETTIDYIKDCLINRAASIFGYKKKYQLALTKIEEKLEVEDEAVMTELALNALDIMDEFEIDVQELYDQNFMEEVDEVDEKKSIIFENDNKTYEDISNKLFEFNDPNYDANFFLENVENKSDLYNFALSDFIKTDIKRELQTFDAFLIFMKDNNIISKFYSMCDGVEVLEESLLNPFRVFMFKQNWKIVKSLKSGLFSKFRV